MKLPAERRAEAIVEALETLREIRRRMEAGPTLRKATSLHLAQKYEALRDALHEAHQRAVEISDHF